MGSNHKLEDSMNHSELTLDIFARQFRAWQGDCQSVCYPRQFWKDIQQLSKQYPINDIAKALAIDTTFLRDRLRKKSFKFAPVYLQTFYNVVSLEFFTVISERPITVRFQSDHKQLIQCILCLLSHKS